MYPWQRVEVLPWLYGGDDFQCYNALVGATRLVFPWVRHADIWDADLVVRNISGSAQTVDVWFYNSDGSQAKYIQNRQINGNGEVDLIGDMPAGFEGSVVVQGNQQPIAAVLNLLRTDYGGVKDGAISYAGVDE